MWPNPHETADLVIFTEEILNGKLHFLWSEIQNFDKMYVKVNVIVAFYDAKRINAIRVKL